MQISELYHAIQGEGQWTGTPSVFVRFTGCNLRCWFCDTPFTSWTPKGEQKSLQQILDQTLQFDDLHVVITGGEPMLQPDLPELTRELKQAGRIITIETAGTIYQPVEVDLISISPKLSNSVPQKDPAWAKRHEERRHQPEVIKQLMEYEYQFKFVIDSPEDLDEVLSYIDLFPSLNRQQVWVMPQATTQKQLIEKSDWLEELADQHSLQFSSRRHIALFGNERGH